MTDKKWPDKDELNLILEAMTRMGRNFFSRFELFLLSFLLTIFLLFVLFVVVLGVF